MKMKGRFASRIHRIQLNPEGSTFTSVQRGEKNFPDTFHLCKKRETRMKSEGEKDKGGEKAIARIEMLEAWSGSTWKARSDVGENKLLPRFQFLTRSARSFFTTFAPSTRPIYAQSSRIRRSSPLVRMRATEPRCSAELNISQRV